MPVSSDEDVHTIIKAILIFQFSDPYLSNSVEQFKHIFNKKYFQTSSRYKLTQESMMSSCMVNNKASIKLDTEIPMLIKKVKYNKVHV